MVIHGGVCLQCHQTSWTIPPARTWWFEKAATWRWNVLRQAPLSPSSSGAGRVTSQLVQTVIWNKTKKKITSIMVEPLFSQCLSASFFVATASSHNTSTFSIPRVNRLDMGAYLCIASNGIPPSVSKRVMLIVHCEYMKPLPLFKLVFREQNNSTSAFKIIKINGSSYHKKMHATLILVDIKCFENWRWTSQHSRIHVQWANWNFNCENEMTWPILESNYSYNFIIRQL